MITEAHEIRDAGRFDDAARMLENEAKKRSGKERAEAYVRAGEIYLATRRHERALSVANRAIEADVSLADAHWVRGDALREDRRVEEARESLEEALRLAPDHLCARLALARIRFRIEDPASTLADFEAFLRGGSDPDLRATARLEYGRALRATKRFQDAADQFAMLLEEDPSESDYYSELSRTLFRMRRRQEAKFVEDIFRAQLQIGFEEYGAEKLKMQGRDVLALCQAANVASQRKQPLRAYGLYRKSIEANSNDARIAIYFSTFLSSIQRAFEARDVLTKAIEKGFEPASGLWQARGRAEAEMKEWSAATVSYERALQALAQERKSGELRGVPWGQADSYAAALALIHAQMQAGDTASAKSGCERLRARRQDAWEPIFWLGRLALRANKIAEAAAFFRDAASLVKQANRKIPTKIDLWHAAALARSGDPRDATALEKMMAGNLNIVEIWEILTEAAAPGSDVRTRAQQNAARAAEIDARINDLEKQLASTDFDSSAKIYLELARAQKQFRSPRALDLILLASDLDERSAEIATAVIPFVSSPQDLFVRVRFLKRIIDVEPDNTRAIHDLAEIYTKLHIRLLEAERLGERLHDLDRGEKTYVIRGRAAILLGKKDRGIAIAREGLAKFASSEALEKLAATP